MAKMLLIAEISKGDLMALELLRDLLDRFELMEVDDNKVAEVAEAAWEDEGGSVIPMRPDAPEDAPPFPPPPPMAPPPSRPSDEFGAGPPPS